MDKLIADFVCEPWLKRGESQFPPLRFLLTFISLISPNRWLDIIVLLEAPGGFPNLSRVVFAPTTARWLGRRVVQKLSLHTHTSEYIGKPVGFHPRDGNRNLLR